VQQTQNLAAIGPSLGLDSTYPFPLECITLQTPAGTPGEADIAITSPDGSVTAPKAFQYLQGENFYLKSSFDKFVIYDQPRQWLYLSDIDHIDVFNLAGAFFGNVIEPPGGPPPSGQIRGLALTPDGTQLVAADFGAQNIYLLDPDTGSGTSIAVGGVSGYVNSGPARVAAHQHAKRLRRFEPGIGLFRRLHVLPRPIEPGGQSSHNSTGLTARNHRSHRRSSCAIEWQWQSGVRRVR
jgi:hypothetical protein